MKKTNKILGLFSGKKKNVPLIQKHARLLNKETIREQIIKTILNTSWKNKYSVGIIFDMNSIVLNNGQLVGAQSSVGRDGQATIIFYIDCLFREFTTNTKVKNLKELDAFLLPIISEQLLSILRPVVDNGAN